MITSDLRIHRFMYRISRLAILGMETGTHLIFVLKMLQAVPAWFIFYQPICFVLIL